MKFLHLLLAVTLFCMCSSFKILFNCGRKKEFPEILWNAFKISRWEDPQKSKQISHFLPLTFQDFVIFLYRLSKLNEPLSSISPNPYFNTLLNALKGDWFCDFSQTIQGTRLALRRGTRNLFFVNEEEPDNLSLFAYSYFWCQNNFLFPYCYYDDLVFGDYPFINESSCEKIVECVASTAEFPFESQNKLIFNPHFGTTKVSLKQYGLSETVSMEEWKSSLFYYKPGCPPVGIRARLVVVSRENKSAIVKGGVSELVALGSLKYFLSQFKLSGNYSPILKGLICIAEKINSYHQSSIKIRNISEENILVLPNEQEKISLDFCTEMVCLTFDNCKTNHQSFELLKKLAKIDCPQGKFDDEKGENEIIIWKQWESYLKMLSRVIDSLKRNFSYSQFDKIRSLLKEVDGKEYWKCDNILQTISEYLNEECEECKIDESFKYESLFVSHPVIEDDSDQSPNESD